MHQYPTWLMFNDMACTNDWETNQYIGKEYILLSIQ